MQQLRSARCVGNRSTSPSWDGVRRCDAFSVAAPQPSNNSNQIFSEDCLFLNVWTTQASDQIAKLPVMV
ncbi:MAG: hypothetical protein M2R45_03803 [Verrucomicrobia subdivision 3 bacterium]|nr:hypothetical protein [Limisphaerales bacterium]MCS1416756.1 hypothetical protein [Limisphaerales bacterium]